MTDIFVPIGILVAVLLILGSAAYAGLLAAPWVPVFKRDIGRIIRLVALRDGEVAVDLGCGDGRIVVALANNSHASVVGYEISFVPYLWSKLRVLLHGLSRRVDIRFADFLSRDLGQANAIFCFLTPMAMKKLAPKFARELRPGTRIVSYSFRLPGWEPMAVDRPDERSIPIFTYLVDGRQGDTLH